MGKLFSEAHAEAADKLAMALKAYDAAFAEVRAVALDQFASEGGCLDCRDAGGTWAHYHDGDSVWDRCQSCSRGEGSHGPVAAAFDPKATDLYTRLCVDLEARLEAARDEFRMLEHRLPIEGDLVRVVRGRKVPIGTEGWVVARSAQRFGFNRVVHSVKLEDGTWVNAENCERVLGVERELPQVGMGSHVTLKSGAEGTVFWKRDMRIGIRATKLSEPIWANVTDVACVAA